MKKQLIRAFLLKGEVDEHFIVAQDVENRLVRYFRVEELGFEDHGSLIDLMLNKNESRNM